MLWLQALVEIIILHLMRNTLLMEIPCMYLIKKYIHNMMLLWYYYIISIDICYVLRISYYIIHKKWSAVGIMYPVWVIFTMSDYSILQYNL